MKNRHDNSLAYMAGVLSALAIGMLTSSNFVNLWNQWLPRGMYITQIFMLDLTFAKLR